MFGFGVWVESRCWAIINSEGRDWILSLVTRLVIYQELLPSRNTSLGPALSGLRLLLMNRAGGLKSKSVK